MAKTLDWSDLQVFVAVCQRGSIAAAAQALQINHSTVLRRLSALESALSVRLFDRLPRGYALTAHGQELAASVAALPEQVEAAQRRVANADLALSGTIRLTAPDTLIQALLWPLLAEFRRLHPKVRLEIAASNSFLNLTQREADVAVRGCNRPPDNLIGRRAGAIRTALYASRDYLETMAPGGTEQDWDWIGHDGGITHLDSAKWIRRQVPEERIVLRVDSLVAMADAVAAGMGVGWVLCPLADARGLEQLQPPPADFDTQVWILTHPDLRAVARIGALTHFLFERLSQDVRLSHAR